MVRLIRVRDAGPLRRLLQENREWLGPWEATLPGYRQAEPGSFDLAPSIRSLRSQLKIGTGVPFVVLHKGELVGQLSVSEIGWGALKSAQLGYWIAQTHAGLGVTPLSVALVIDYLMRDLGLHRVEICLVPENQASRRVVEKLGLRFEGRRERYIHIDGAWRDHDCFAVTEEEAGAGMVARLTHAD